MTDQLQRGRPAADTGMTDARLLKRWVLATWGGWALGVPTIALFALIGEAMGIGGSQVLVGAGMGAAVGLTQGRIVKGLFGRFLPWFLASMLGLAAPFLVSDLAPYSGWQMEYSLYRAVLFGGVVVGIWQALLRPRVRMPALWALASAGRGGLSHTWVCSQAAGSWSDS